MKVSISLPDADIAFVDEYASRSAATSRSAVVHRAIELLRESELEDAYAEAWQDWASDDGEDESAAEAWEPAAADGLVDAPR